MPDYFQKLKALQLPAGKFALFGSAPMVVKGLRTARDIDIIVTKDLWQEYHDKGWEEKTALSGSRYLTQDNIELWQDWKPGEWDIEKLIKEAEIIDGLPFVRLEEVAKWKKLFVRKKDFRDLEIINNYLLIKN